MPFGEREVASRHHETDPVSSSDQMADFFTKPLLPQPFNTLLFKLGMLDIYHSPACGGLLEKEEENRKSNNRLLGSTGGRV